MAALAVHRCTPGDNCCSCSSPPTPCAATIAGFSQVSPLAAWLMAPTQGWVSIASKLNWDIVRLNPEEKGA